MREIIIAHPEFNTNRYRRFSYSENHKRHVAWLLENDRITPETHRFALDIPAGDGPGAWIFRELGWPESRIMCMDIAKPNPPIVRGLAWKFVDINAMGKLLLAGHRRQIPMELRLLKKHFNIILTSYSEADPRYMGPVIRHFLARGGKSITL